MSLPFTPFESTIKKGSPFPQGQRYTIDYDPQRGFTYYSDYFGGSQEQLLALQQTMIQNGVACRLELYEDVGTLHVDDSTSQWTIDSWEIAGSSESVDGLAHPTMLALFAGGLDTNVAKMRQALQDNQSVDDFYNDLVNSGFSPTDAETASNFYILQQRGQTAFRQPSYVLRHRTNVSNRWQANVSDVGVNTIYTPAQLLTEVTSSGVWIFPLPPRLQFKLAAIPPLAPEAGYLWGWLKSPSVETTAANNRVDITTEYQIGLISLNYYALFNGIYSSQPYY